IQAQTAQRELTRWRVLVCAAPNPTERLGTEELGIEGLGPGGLINRSRLAKDPTSLGVITGPSDELFGLTPEDIADAGDRAANREFPTKGRAYRSKRSPEEGLLLLYPISGRSQPGRNAKNRVALFDNSENPPSV